MGTSSPMSRIARLGRSTAVAALLAITLLPHPVEGRHYAPGVPEARTFALRKIGAAQFRCLDRLWERESHWNPLAHNRRSGAHGIPQALPGSKMGPGWRTDPMVQVRWGLRYVRIRYGGACNAYDHALRTGWY